MVGRKYPYLFSPIKIGPLTLKNRIVSAPTSLAELSAEGHLTRDNIAYYKLKARVCRRPSALIYVTANGNVLPCCFSPFTTRDYAGLLLGNAFETSLLDIWNGAAYRQFRAALQTDAPPEACDGCGACWSL